MRRHYKRPDEGQTLVVVAILLVVLLAFVALAVDFGRMYLERRFVQNAADAAALAGARVLCFQPFGGPTAEDTARLYAMQNIPDPAGLQIDVETPGNGVVRVNVKNNAASGLAGIVGLGTVGINAQAAAQCGPSTAACGLFPLALPSGEWDSLKNLCFAPFNQFYVWSGDFEDRNPEPPNPVQPDCLNTCNCNVDINEDGLVDRILWENDRAWLDFTSVVPGPLDPDYGIYPSWCALSPVCDPVKLDCWAQFPETAPIRIPASGSVCIGGENGIEGPSQTTINLRSMSPNTYRIPIYTGGCGAPFCSQGYSVTAFGCMQLGGFYRGELGLGVVLPYQDTSIPGACWTGKLIRVSVSCGDAACNSPCGGTTPGAPSTGGSEVNSVSLIE
jgi:hypothetical protein